MGLHRRSFRAFIHLLVCMTLLLPTAPAAPAHAAPVAAPPAAPRPAPALAVGTEPTKPADAASTGMPTSKIDELRKDYGARHTADGVLDGSFSVVSTAVYTGFPSLSQDFSSKGIGSVEKITSIPPMENRDSLRLSVELENDDPKAGYMKLDVRTRASGSANWETAHIILEKAQGTESTGIIKKQLSLDQGIPISSSIELSFTCTGVKSYTEVKEGVKKEIEVKNFCNIFDISVFHDVTGWQTNLGNTDDIWAYDVNSVAVDSISSRTKENPFLSIKTNHNGAVYGVSLKSNTIAFPSIKSTDIVTASVWWMIAVTNRNTTDTSTYGANFGVYRLSDTTNIGTRFPISASSSALPTNWQKQTIWQANGVDVSDQQISLYIDSGHSIGNSTVALDDLTFYVNGQPLQALPIFLDTGSAACSCTMAGYPQADGGDPVNTFSGSYYEPFTDLVVPTPSQPLTLGRSYSSLLAQTATQVGTALSPGWRHTFDERLTFADQPGGEVGKVIYETASSNRLRFLDNEDGTFTGVPGVYATLARQGSSYVVTVRDRSTATFNADGLLTKRTDAQGHDQNLTYANGRLDRVTDAASGRFLSFAYTEAAGQQRLHTVTDSAGRSITYGYSDQGDLTTVTDLRGGVTTYTYSHGSLDGDDQHLLTGIIDPLGVPQLTNVYDLQNRVRTQQLANGQRIIFTYRHGVADGASPTVWDTEVATAAGQPPAKITAEPAAVVGRASRMSFAAKTVYFPMIMEDAVTIPAGADIQIDHYRLDGTLEYQERGGQITSYVTYDASGTPTTIVDGAERATTVSNNRVGQPLQVVNASGHTTTATYRSDNQISTLRGADSILNAATYDARGNLAAVVQGTGSMRLTTAYTYTTDNRVQEVKDEAGIRTRYAYDALGQLTDVTVGYGTADAQTTHYAYDPLGRVTDITTAYGTPLARTDHVDYNPDGTAQRRVANFKDGVFDPAKVDEDVITTYGYDLLGRAIWTRSPAGRYDVTHYRDGGQVDWTARNLTGYSGGGALPAAPPAFTPSAPDANVATFYGYDGLGRTELVTETGILTGTFDPATLRFQAATTRTTRTEYDEQSRPVTVTLNYRPGLPTSADTNLQTITYYDGAGNVTWSRDTLGRWTRYEYDELGRSAKTTVNYENGDPTSVYGKATPTPSVTPTPSATPTTAPSVTPSPTVPPSPTTPPTPTPDNTGWTDGHDTDLVQVNRYNAKEQLEQVITNYVDGTWVKTEPVTDTITLYTYDNLGRSTKTTQYYTAVDPLYGGTNPPSLASAASTTYPVTSTLVLRSLNAFGIATGYSYDGLGRAVMTTQNCRSASGPCGTYDLNNYRNIATRTEYDARGQVARTIQNYQDGSYTASLSDQDRITQYTYDGLGRMTATTQNPQAGVTPDAATNVTSQTVYDVLGQTIRTIAPSGVATQRGYDALGNTTVITDAMGRVTRMGYDGAGQLRWTRRGDGQVSLVQLDGLGRTTQTVLNVVPGSTADDTNITTRQTYDRAGRVVSRTDALGHVTQYTYDLRDNLTSVTENVLAVCDASRTDCNITTRYTYDRMGNRTAIIDARGNRRTFTYTATSALSTATNALGQTTSWRYDQMGRMTEIHDPRGTPFDRLLSYNDLGQMIWIAGGAGTTLGRIGFIYDGAGRRKQLGDPLGNTTYTYDALGHLDTVTLPNKQGTIQYDYNKDGARQTLIYPSKRAVSYDYYADGQLKTVSEGQAATPLASYTYDAVGRPATVQRANGTQTTYGFDGADRLRMLTTTQTSTNVTLASFGYTVNALGQRTQVRETLPDHSRTIAYAYDGLGRLETADASTGTDYTYRYDVVGNRTDSGKTYNAANQVVGWSYDAAGNLTSDGTTTYAYDALGRVTTLNGVTQRYNGDGVLMQSGTITYTQDVALALPQVIQTLGTDYVYGADRLAEVKPAARTWYAADALGSVRLTTSDTGAALSSIDYDPWGAVERGTVARFGFTGELQQGSSVHLRARWYNASSGSFASVDPYAGDPASPASLAPYMYAYNQPTLFTDPSGRCIAWLDPYCKSVDWFILEAVQGRVHEYSGFHDSALYFAGVADGVASPVKTVYALTQPQTWQNVGRGYQYLKEHPQEGSNILKEEYVDPVVRGGSFVLSNLATPGNIMHRVNDKPYEIGQVLGSNAPIGIIGKFALRNLMPYRSLMIGGQEASTLCTTSAPKVAKLKLFPYKLLPGQEGFVPRMTGLFDPMAERFRGLVTPEHVAVRNLDGSITDRTILMNISRANKWILPAELEKFRGIDTFDLRTYNKLLDTWQDLFTKGLDANGISKTWNNLSKGLIEQDTTPNQNGGGLDIPDDFWQLPDDY